MRLGRQGPVWYGSQGTASSGSTRAVGHGAVWQAWQREACPGQSGMTRRGEAGKVGQGMTRCGLAGDAGQREAWFGTETSTTKGD